MDTPSTSVSGAMGRSTKKKKVTQWEETDNTFDHRDSTRTPPTLIKVNSWMDTLDQSNKKEEEERGGGSPDFYGFDNLNYPYSANPHYDLISNGSYQNEEEKLIEDELKQYCSNISDTVSEISNGKSSINLRPATRQRKLSQIIVKDLDECDNVLPSPENENKKELCKYLQLMKPTDKKSVIILQNRRSKRVTNLSKMELEKKLKTSIILDRENDSIVKTKRKFLDYKAPYTFDFPKPPDNIDFIDFDGIAEENWFKEWSEEAKKRSDRTAIKRKSQVSVKDIMLDECSGAEMRTRRKSNILDSNENESTTKITRSKSRGPSEIRSPRKIHSDGKRGRRDSRGSAMTKRNSIDTSESRDSDKHKSTPTKKTVNRSKSRNSNRGTNRSESGKSITSKRLNGSQNKNGFNEKAKGIIEENVDFINIKTRSMEPIIKKNLRRTVKTSKTNKDVASTKARKRKRNNAKTGFKIKGPGYKIRLFSAKRRLRRRSNNSKTAAKSAPTPRPAKKPQINLTISESDFDTRTKIIQEQLSNLSKSSDNLQITNFSDSSCSEVAPGNWMEFGSQFKNLESQSGNSLMKSNTNEISGSTIKTICFYESDRPSTTNQLNGVLKRQDSAIQTEPEEKHQFHTQILNIQKTCAIQTEPEEKRQFHSQILNIQKTSDEDSEEDPSDKSGSTSESAHFNGCDKKQTTGTEKSKWTNTKKQLENQNSINLNTRQGPILKIFYVDFDLVLCQELSVSFWNQSAPGNVLGAHDMWTSKGSIQRQAMSNNCTLKDSLEMVACNYFSLAYIELWTKEHESYQQDVPVTNVYAIIYFWMKQYNGLVKKVLQLENINGFADDVQYSIVKSSPKIVVSWHFTGNEVNRKKTYVYCYQVASDFQSICNVDKFEAVDHYVSSLHNIEGCDTLIMGCGENKITLWNIEGGRLAATIEMTEIKSPLATLWVKCDRGFLFTLQQCVDRELRLIAIHSMNHSWKRLARYKPPQIYDRLKGVCVENGIVLGFYDQGIVCWNAGSQEIVVESAARKETEYISGNYLISVANNEVHVRHAFTSLLELGYWN